MTLHFIRGIVVGAAGIGLFGAACTYEPPSASNTGGEGGQGTGGSASTSGSGGNAGGAGGMGMGGKGGAGGAAPTDWWDKSWQHRVKITFKNGGGDTLYSFPVMVRLNEARAKGISLSLTGSDIRFVDADGITPLPYEIEGWQNTADSFVWVNVPTIDASETDYIWLYYGNSGVTSAEKAPDVWPGYTAVFHMSEPVAPIRSSIGGIQGHWSTGTASTLVAGRIHKAMEFTNTRYIKLGDNDPVAIGPAQARTIEAWVNVAIEKQNHTILFQEGQCLGWALSTTLNGEFLGHFATSTLTMNYCDNYQESSVVSPSSSGAWRYLALTIDRPKKSMSLFVDGVAAPMTAVVDSMELGDGGGIFTIGSDYDGGTDTFIGFIDEVRISDNARTPGWIAAQNKSMKDTFAVFGPVDGP